MDKFAAAVREIKTEQLLSEKTASALDIAASEALRSKIERAEDPELLKVAEMYCPEDYIRFYEDVLGGKFKAVG